MLQAKHRIAMKMNFTCFLILSQAAVASHAKPRVIIRTSAINFHLCISSLV